MATELTLARQIALSLIFSCAGIASGQNASVLPPSGAGSSGGSGGSGAVDYSSSASLSDVNADSSVADASVSATPSALTASESGGGGSSAHQSTQHLGGSLSGGNQSPSNSATSASRSGSSRGAAASASSNGSGARQSSHSGQGVAAMESGLTGHKLESAATGAKLSSAQAKARLSEEDEARSGSGSAGGGGQYPTGFPDSTRNTAVLSPPDPANNSLFVFDPAVGGEFPDLAEREFLSPTLRVGRGSSGMGKKQDLYQRIEQRLRNYRTEDEPKGHVKASPANQQTPSLESSRSGLKF